MEVALLSMGRILSRGFFNRPTLTVARELIGKYLVRKIGRKTLALKITETEAYDGFHDKASHASRGKTKRNEPMFGTPGHFYVYFTYGMHWMLNVVTREKGYPAALLIRAAGGYNGPAKLTKALKIDKRLNALRASPETGLWFEGRKEKVESYQVKGTSRIGVDYAGPVWSKKRWRFVLKKD